MCYVVFWRKEFFNSFANGNFNVQAVSTQTFLYSRSTSTSGPLQIQSLQVATSKRPFVPLYTIQTFQATKSYQADIKFIIFIFLNIQLELNQLIVNLRISQQPSTHQLRSSRDFIYSISLLPPIANRRRIVRHRSADNVISLQKTLSIIGK